MSRKRKKSNIPDTPPQELKAEDLEKAFSELTFIEVLNSGISDDKARVLMRIHDDSSWFPILKLILREEKRQASRPGSWSAHVCRQFMLRPDDDEVLGFAWNFIIRGPDIAGAVADIGRVIDIAKSAVTIEPIPEQKQGIIPVRKVPKRIEEVRQKKKLAKEMTKHKMQPDRGPDSGRLLGSELTEYPLMAKADRNMPEVDFFAPTGVQGKRKGAHLIGG